MRRPLAVLILVGSVLGLAACSGGTDPATNVTNVSAQLNAHGHTTGEPATWWWEYDTVQSDLGTANDTEVCGSGTGPKEADNRCGPASSPSSDDIPLKFTVTGLAPNTTYYFRACGQDQSASSGACGKTLSFKTLAGTSYAFDDTWGSYGTGNGRFNRPAGIAVDSSNNVYVADKNNDRIQKFSSTGAFITKWGTRGGAWGQFASPAGVAVDLLGNVWVADTGNDRIEQFSTDGSFIGGLGSGGVGDGQFAYPYDVAASRLFRNGGFAYSEYVADTGNNRIQRFSPTGGFLGKWGWLGTGDGQFAGPVGIGAYPAGGWVYVADSGNDRIQAFNAANTFITKWGTEGTGHGQFYDPHGVAVDRLGDVYVADTGNNRIQKFGPTGAFITTWGYQGTGDRQFEYPWDVAVDELGYVYVTDTYNNRIQRFKPVQY